MAQSTTKDKKFSVLLLALSLICATCVVDKLASLLRITEPCLSAEAQASVELSLISNLDEDLNLLHSETPLLDQEDGSSTAYLAQDEGKIEVLATTSPEVITRFVPSAKLEQLGLARTANGHYFEFSHNSLLVDPSPGEGWFDSGVAPCLKRDCRAIEITRKLSESSARKWLSGHGFQHLPN